MRLLNTHSETIEAPEDRVVPNDVKYAILSHTWGDQEITLSDLYHGRSLTNKSGWTKLDGARKQAARDEFDYIWVDTCCIDKSSTAELSEAINSMFVYYQRAKICYVYLEDIERQNEASLKDEFVDDQGTIDRNSLAAKLCKSRWFSRGWTLQELIAPWNVVFFDRHWNRLANLRDIRYTVSTMTGIHSEVFASLYALETRQQRIAGFSVAQRLSWAARRQTTREEDRAYSLFGILSVNIDIRYGEGSKAFNRLQEALIETTTDQSIFAWEYSSESPVHTFLGMMVGEAHLHETLLAPSPDAFAHCHDIVPFRQAIVSPRLTNRGIHMTCPVVLTHLADATREVVSFDGREGIQLNRWNAQLWLGCRYTTDPMTAIMLNVCGSNGDESNLGKLDEQAYHLGAWSRVMPASENVLRLRSPRLSYVNAIESRERSDTVNAIVMRPSPHSDSTRNLQESQTTPSVWISLSGSAGFSAPRIERVEPNTYWHPDREPCLLKAADSMLSDWSHAVVSVRYLDCPSVRMMFAVESLAQPGARAFLALELTSSNKLQSAVEVLEKRSDQPNELLGSTWDKRAKWIQALPESHWNRLPIEQTLQLDRSLVLVATMKRSRINGEHMVIVQARVESISSYRSHQLSRRIQLHPRATLLHFTFLLCLVIIFSGLVAFAVADFLHGESKIYQNTALVLLVGLAMGMAGRMMPRAWFRDRGRQ